MKKVICMIALSAIAFGTVSVAAPQQKKTDTAKMKTKKKESKMAVKKTEKKADTKKM